MIKYHPSFSWRLIRWTLLALSVSPASQNAFANDPRLGPFEYPQPRALKSPEADETFDAYEALNGSYTSEAKCAGYSGRIWIDLGDRGDCIRYYQYGLENSGNETILVYFGGDVMLRTQRGVRFITGSYTEQSPATIEADMRRWSEQAGIAAVFVARPGIYGSSGDHNERRHRREMELMNRALDAIKERHGISSFILTGHSAGGQIVAALLNWRDDVRAVVISSGMTSVKQVAKFWERRRKIPGRLLYDVDAFYDPVSEIDRIETAQKPEIYVLSDPEDRSVPFFSQLYYVRRLRNAGLDPKHLYLHATGRQRHLLVEYARLASAMIAQGEDELAIRRAVSDLEVENLHEQHMQKAE